MPAWISHFRLSRSAPILALACAFATAPAAMAEDASLPHDIVEPADSGLAGSTAPTGLSAPGYLQRGDIDENILLPTRGDDIDDDDESRKWARDYFAVAAGVMSTPSYNGSDDRTLLPAFYIRGRVSGFSFSTRGTNLQVDLLRQRRGAKTDVKFGPIVSLRSDRTGRIKDPQVEALGEKKLAVEVGAMAGISHTGVITSRYDQIAFRVVALKDVSGRHGSWAFSPTIDYGTPLSKRLYVGMSASINFYGKGFGRYYFDIDPAGSAASGLPVYSRAGVKGGAGKYTLGLASAYALSGDLRKGFVLIGGAQYGRMLGRIADSPIVSIAGSRNQWLAGGGIAYQF